MKPRLETLVRQRELVREHLRWLDGEIASEERGNTQPDPAVPVTSNLPATNPAPPRDVSAVLPELDTKNLHDEVRRGCFIYAAIAFGTLVLVVAYVYWKY